MSGRNEAVRILRDVAPVNDTGERDEPSELDTQSLAKSLRARVAEPGLAAPRELLARPAGSVLARYVRWGTEDDGEKRVRLPQAARPSGLVFSTINWSGLREGVPTQHQKTSTVDAVFANFNWT